MQHIIDEFIRGKITKALSRSVVYQLQNGVQLLISNFGKVGSSWKKEPEQPIDILIAAALPWSMSIRKIDRKTQSLFHIFKPEKFCSVVQSKRYRAYPLVFA